ncbi:MAG TPA: tryptophan 7-halogenase [Vicinamibacterales bacterium]|jgi:2-polyprenyl-6-methoxyphenol hydroxylase-like FAD-dependent oxidoreductase|nr:tryptophan 7-halogenase [Vicinamibacterales bacterium]
MPGTRPPDTPDVLVIGGGPAGSTAARLLASWGWTVRLAHRPASRPALAESLPPSTRKVLALLGQTDTIGAAPFFPNHGNVAWWGGSIRETRSDEAGFHVARAGFDALLRQAARAAGVSIVDAIVRRVEAGEAPSCDLLTCEGQPLRVAPRLVLDCSGHASLVARRGGFGRVDAPYRTLALAAEWESEAWPDAERTRTVVESFADGWAWSVPLSSTKRHITVMLDPDFARTLNAGARDTALQRIYAHALADAPRIHARAARARQITRPWGANASVYHSASPCAPGVLLAGDAASFIEPLSSAGVKKAMLSAWRAAVVANTILGHPAMIPHAFAFYAAREREVYEECRQAAAGFFREAAAYHRSPFWEARVAAEADPAPDVALRQAHERLRAAPRARLRVPAGLRFGSAPEVEGREIVLREAIVIPGSDTPVRFAAGVNLPALVRLAGKCDDVGSIFSAYHAHVGPAPVDSLVTGLSVLVARQALILEDARP